MTYRVGIAGAGFMGKIHGGLLRGQPRVHVVAVADPDAERARILAALCDAKAVATFQDLLREKLDVLFIASPNFTHVLYTLQALEQGISVFCEKPMALNVQEGRQVLEAVEKSGLLYQLGFNRRFAPAYLAVKKKIDSGFIPYLADIKMREGEITARPWATDVAKTGGHLRENVLHFLDMVQWLQGPIREIFAVGRANVYQDMTDYILTFVTENDRLASISTSGHATWFRPWERMEVIGDHEAVITEEVNRFTHSPGNLRPIQSTLFDQLPMETRWGYAGEVKAFFDTLDQKAPSPYSAEMGLEILQLIDACHESVRTGQKIVLPAREKGGLKQKEYLSFPRVLIGNPPLKY